MGEYSLNKFLYAVDRNPERYRDDLPGTVTWREAERDALAAHNYLRLFEMGAARLSSFSLPCPGVAS